MNELVTDLPEGWKLSDVVEPVKDKFLSLASDTGIAWEKEALFAYQALTKNSYIMDVVKQNPASVRNAIMNVASIGLSLNPATSYAYLVPRKPDYKSPAEICLDISYQGLIKIATDSGSILWAKAELVYEGDQVVYKGIHEPPDAQIDPFNKNRGTDQEFKGVFCTAKTKDGDYLVEFMQADEIFKIRAESSSMSSEKGQKHSPWTRYFGEMAKKTVIKRASKTWPKTEHHERLQEAVNYLNDTQGSEWAEETHRFAKGEKEEIITRMREYLANGDAFGVLEIVQDYKGGDGVQPDTVDYEKQIKFWSLFSSAERSAIERLLDDSKIERDRITMGKPELNEPINTGEL